MIHLFIIEEDDRMIVFMLSKEQVIAICLFLSRWVIHSFTC